MTMEEFELAVLSKLREYVGDEPEEVLRGYVRECPDIMGDGYRDPYGEGHGVQYAAWNISQCV